MMSQELTATDRVKVSADLQEKALLGGDLSKLSASERLSYYNSVCTSLGLNPLTRPFEYIVLSNKLTLYARKDCTEQLRTIRKISVEIKSRELTDGIYVVTARATEIALPMMQAGTYIPRTDESIGAVDISKLQGDAKANAMMKAETKAKRRVTLSICGLGMLDETEIETIPDAKVINEQEDGAGNGLSSRPSGNQQASDAPAFIWRIGKFKGIPITELEEDYLEWARQNMKLEDHREAAQMELDRRQAEAAFEMDAPEE